MREDPIGLVTPPDDLHASWECIDILRRRERHGRMAGDVEELREPQHRRPDRLGAPLTSTVVAPSERRGNRERRQEQRVALVERPVDRRRQRLPQIQGADVVLGEEITAHLEPHAHAR